MDGNVFDGDNMPALIWREETGDVFELNLNLNFEECGVEGKSLISALAYAIR